MARGLSDLQRCILWIADTNRKNYPTVEMHVINAEVLSFFYSFPSNKRRALRWTEEAIAKKHPERSPISKEGRREAASVGVTLDEGDPYRPKPGDYRFRDFWEPFWFDVEQIGRGRYRAAHAAVSRAFTRLCNSRGLLDPWYPGLCRQGGGALGYSLTEKGIDACKKLNGRPSPIFPEPHSENPPGFPQDQHGRGDVTSSTPGFGEEATP